MIYMGKIEYINPLKPEFDPDGEKIQKAYADYCDNLLAKIARGLGIPAELLDPKKRNDEL